MKLRLRLISLSAPVVALGLAVGLTSLILLGIGKDPIETFVMMFEYCLLYTSDAADDC